MNKLALTAALLELFTMLASVGRVAHCDTATAPSVVKIVSSGGSFHMVRNGQPFFIKGAGGDGSLELLKQCGGNSIRTWGADNLDNTLAEANKVGIGVTVGIWLGHKEQGFRYDDPAAVAKQLDMARNVILRYRNSPALLMWGLGNEMEGYDGGDDPNVWHAVEDIAKMVKQLDPNHPTMTVVAEIGGNKVRAINQYCPDIDVIGINSYGGGPSLPTRYVAAGGTKPYVVTEYGPAGTWEVPKNSWGASAELTSTQKAESYKATYEKAIANQPLCLGGYAFTWGHKQEASATWFGLMLSDGSKLAGVDALATLWSGHPPAVLCPKIESLTIDGSPSVKSGDTVDVHLVQSDPQGQAVKVTWILSYDPVVNSVGGATQPAQPQFPDSIVESSNTGAKLKMPPVHGGFRIYAILHNASGAAAVGNVVLYVSDGGDAPVPDARKATLPFVLYGAADQPFVTSGYMGNFAAITVDANCPTNTRGDAKSCMKATYGATDNWAGVVWQNPPNNWGDLPGGWNITGAKQLSFWARGDKGGEKVTFEYGLIGADKKFHDSSSGKMADVILTTAWQHYTIDLTGKDLSRIVSGFCWTVAGSGNPTTFYLDDIRYE